MRRGRAVAGLAMIGLAVVIFMGWSPWVWASPWSSGEVTLVRVAGAVDVESSSGSISGSGLAGRWSPARARVTSRSS